MRELKTHGNLHNEDRVPKKVDEVFESILHYKRRNVCSIRADGELSRATRFPVVIQPNYHVFSLGKSQGAAISVDVKMHEHTPSQLLYSPSSANRAP